MSLIFKDRNKLSPYYIPSNLPHRDFQMKALDSLYGYIVKDSTIIYPRFTQIIGNTGSGKTCTAIKFGDELTKKAVKAGHRLKCVYVNCKVDGATRYVLFGNLVKKITSKISTRSLSPEEMLRQLVEYLRTEKILLFAIFDEIDYYIRSNPKEHIIYDLTRITEMNPGESTPIVGSIFIARSLKWHELLEPGERSTLGMGVIEFPSYITIQVREILENRIKEAFNPGIIQEDTLDLVSDITTSPNLNGDIRFGLDLLYYAGNLAENLGLNKVLPDHVRKVSGMTSPTITSEDIMNLNRDLRLVLLSVVRSLKAKKSAYVRLKDIRASYKIICEELETMPSKKFEEQLQDLIYRGIVDMKSLIEIGISTVSVNDLEDFLNNLVERLEKI